MRILKERINPYRYIKYKNDPPRSIKGEGIVDFIKDKFSKFSIALRGRPKVLNDLMESTKGIPVVSITVCRKPINSVFQKILNFVTFGKVNQELKKTSHDTLFHLYAVFTLSNGATWLIEKNERVMVLTGKGIVDKQTRSVCEPSLSINNGNDINTYILKLEALNIKDIYVYNSFSKNCQDFIKNLFNANGIRQYDNFIYQPVSKLAPPIIQNIAKGITDIAAGIDVIVKGGKYTD
jgi:hypothetical protein